MEKESLWTVEARLAIWDNYRVAVYHSRERIHTAKAQLKLKVASMVVDNKKGMFKYVDSKRRVKETLVCYFMRLITSQMWIKQKHFMPSSLLSRL